MKSQKIAEEDFRYQLPKDEWLVKKIDEFEEFLGECKKKLEIEDLEIEINHVLLINIFA